MVISTKNFHPDTDPKLLCTCGHPNCDRRSVTQDTLDALQLVRDDLGEAMSLTSGGRCPYHPDQARKADPNGGDHPRGDGVDVRVRDRQHYDKIAILAGRHGFNAIGDGLKHGFIHLGRRVQKHVSSWGY
ncbi:peptidase m15a [Vibrio phage CKB-S1]|nr:peptidase m15a [Vibrio phage CKB-S1]